MAKVEHGAELGMWGSGISTILSRNWIFLLQRIVISVPQLKNQPWVGNCLEESNLLGVMLNKWELRNMVPQGKWPKRTHPLSAKWRLARLFLISLGCFWSVVSPLDLFIPVSKDFRGQLLSSQILHWTSPANNIEITMGEWWSSQGMRHISASGPDESALGSNPCTDRSKRRYVPRWVLYIVFVDLRKLCISVIKYFNNEIVTVSWHAFADVHFIYNWAWKTSEQKRVELWGACLREVSRSRLPAYSGNPQCKQRRCESCELPKAKRAHVARA